MKTKYYSVRQIEEALKQLDANPSKSESGYEFRPFRFLKFLSETKPGATENVVISTIEPE